MNDLVVLCAIFLIVVALVFLICILAKGLMTGNLFGVEGYSPDLIDLQRYEEQLLYEKRHGLTLRPPYSIPESEIQWTPAEIQAMRDNRTRAWDVYETIKKEENQHGVRPNDIHPEVPGL